MPVKATIAAGKYNVVMPDGNRYQAGDTVVLTDEEYASISNAAKTAMLTAVTNVTDPSTANDSEVNSPAAVVDVAGHTTMGDANAQTESQKPGKDTTYG